VLKSWPTGHQPVLKPVPDPGQGYQGHAQGHTEEHIDGYGKTLQPDWRNCVFFLRRGAWKGRGIRGIGVQRGNLSWTQIIGGPSISLRISALGSCSASPFDKLRVTPADRLNLKILVP
jgi:hypothetical protein